MFTNCQTLKLQICLQTAKRLITNNEGTYMIQIFSTTYSVLTTKYKHISQCTEARKLSIA